MSELKVGSERQCLRHGDVAPSLEHHHCDWPSGQSVTNNQLRDDVESDLLVGDSLDHADRNDVHECDDLRYT